MFDVLEGVQDESGHELVVVGEMFQKVGQVYCFSFEDGVQEGQFLLDYLVGNVAYEGCVERVAPVLQKQDSEGFSLKHCHFEVPQQVLQHSLAGLPFKIR